MVCCCVKQRHQHKQWKDAGAKATKKHEHKERKLQFRHERVEDTSLHFQIVDYKWVQSLSTPPLAVVDSVIYKLIHIHATMWEQAPSCLLSCEVQGLISTPASISLYLPLHSMAKEFLWRFLGNLLIFREACTVGYFSCILQVLCPTSSVLCLRMPLFCL